MHPGTRAGGSAPAADSGRATGATVAGEDSRDGAAARAGTEAGQSAEAGPVMEAERVAAAVRAVPLVADLSGGPFGGVGTYLRGRRIPGVRVGPRVVEVHVTGRYGHPVAEIAGAVRAAVALVTGDQRIDVVIEDLA
ncbi:MAG TPA: hypothetical protein VKV80_08185 [Streptosporangiaceae bacterium]|nr:hypothetical protein [Streptosporangiaceae bacterium]